ncbi:MAG TPA: hypothetical protein VMU12_00565 [Candidatus Paceibacterota bacterium]|nr:hypothetical protein [Candidatus Paceibacterota bacterium]
MKLPVVIGAGVLIVVAVGTASYVYVSGRKPVDAQQAALDEVSRLVAAVGKLYALPTGETPVVATVTDMSKLAGQPFFKNAKVGDKVLIYNTAQIGILYDPVANILVEVAPLSLGAKPSVTP